MQPCVFYKEWVHAVIEPFEPVVVESKRYDSVRVPQVGGIPARHFPINQRHCTVVFTLQSYIEFSSALDFASLDNRSLTKLAWLGRSSDHNVFALKIGVCKHRFVALKNRGKRPAIEMRFPSITLVLLGDLQVLKN